MRAQVDGSLWCGSRSRRVLRRQRRRLTSRPRPRRLVARDRGPRRGPGIHADGSLCCGARHVRHGRRWRRADRLPRAGAPAPRSTDQRSLPRDVRDRGVDQLWCWGGESGSPAVRTCIADPHRHRDVARRVGRRRVHLRHPEQRRCGAGAWASPGRRRSTTAPTGAVSSGGSSMCTIRSSELWCGGSNQYGELATGARWPSPR